jgi:hypothetical protein
MDFMPEGMEAVRASLEGIDRNVPVAVEPARCSSSVPRIVRPERGESDFGWG